jgi:hypothetical protein
MTHAFKESEFIARRRMAPQEVQTTGSEHVRKRAGTASSGELGMAA